MADKEKVKEILNDPAKLDAELKKFFAEMDKDKKGYVTFDCVHHSLEDVMRKLGKDIHEEDHKPGELEAAEKICDPKKTGKVEFEGFKALVLASIKYHKEHPDH